jgi:hypothetical protein
MTTSEIERLLTATLQAHAEDAMNHTDTQTQLETLERESAREHRRRAGWVAGGLVAAAAAVGMLVWWQVNPDPADVEPAPPVDVPTQAEQVATAFVEAWGDFDRPRIASYVADVASVRIGIADGKYVSWRVANRWDQATGFAMHLDGCFETFGSGDSMDVGCVGSVHQLGSEQLGRGPYHDYLFLVRVENGKVAGASKDMLYDGSELDDEMLIPFWRWMDAEHPEDAKVMAAYEDPASTGAEIDASIQLWEQRTQDYVDAVHAGNAE